MTAPAAPAPTLAQRILARISRPSSGGAFVPEMDGLRFVAILWVVLYHVAPLHSAASIPVVRTIAGSGHYGVELFFVISGFVLALPFAGWRLKGGSPVVPKKYYLRRLTRLEPPYLLSLLVYFVLKVVTKGAGFAELAPHLLASSAYLHNAIYATESTVSVVAWSLEVEVQFYLLAPVLGRVFLLEQRSTRTFVFAALIGAGMVLAASNSHAQTPRLYLSLPGFLHYFLIGFLFAEGYLLGGWRDRRRSSLAFDAVGLGAIVTLTWVVVGWYDDWVGQTAGPLLCACFCFCAFHGRALNAFFRNPWVYSFGGMCYTIYLYHSLVVHAAGAVVRKLHLPGLAAILVEGVLAVGAVAAVSPLIYLLTERPFMRSDWVQRLRARISAQS